MAALPDGSVVVVGLISLGSAYKGSSWLTALVKPDGSWKGALESRLAPPCAEYIEYPYAQADAVAVQADGNVLVGGFSCTGASSAATRHLSRRMRGHRCASPQSRATRSFSARS